MAIKSDNDYIVVDKNFYVPPFIIDVRTAGEEDYGTTVNDTGSGSGYDPGEAASLFGGGGSVIQPPTSFSIVSQTVRIAPDGSAVVDVVLEFPDSPGIKAVDVRVTKA